MKIFCFIAFLFLSLGKIFSQDPAVKIFHLDSLPALGALLDKGWKFHPGDDPEWAKPEFDDSQWEDINPTIDLYYLPQIQRESIGWLRIKLQVDSILLNIPLAFQVYQSIASEIYLNGKLVAAYGSIQSQNEKTRAYRTDHTPTGLIFQNPEQVIAVRFAVQKGLPFTGSNHPYYAFRLRILDIKQTSVFREIEIGHDYRLNLLWAGIYLTLALIHLGIFLRFRNRKADLYFSLALISGAIAHILFIILGRGGQNLSFIAYGFVIDWILLIPVYNLFLYLAIRQLFALKRGILHWTIISLIIAGVIFFIFSYEYGQNIGLHSGFLLTIILSVIQALKAFKNGAKEALIIVIGFSIYLIIYTCFLLFYIGFINDFKLGIFKKFSLMDLFYFFGVISVPSSLSLFLARDFASISLNLQKKLQEVQYLSAKTLQQELEKQRMDLENQKAMELERLRISIELHDDIGATLSSVKAYSEILKNNPDNPLIAELIKDNSTEMIERLEVIAWATNPQYDHFKSLKNLMIKFAAPLCHFKNVQCHIESNGINEEMLMSGEVRQNIYLVFKEAINNMIKYAEATECNTQVFIRDNKFVVQITDNGKGSDGTIKGSGSGWKNMRKRTEDLNGKLVIDSEPGKGTIITMSLPYPFKIPSSWDLKRIGYLCIV